MRRVEATMDLEGTRPVLLLDTEGNEFRAERATVALCRCGESTTKAFCDGTHSRIGFRAAQRAVREEVG